MRLLLLDSTVVLLCVLALIKPKIGLYGYIWYALMRPDNLAWVENLRPYSMFLASATLAGIVLTSLAGIPRVFRNPFMPLFLALNMLYLLSAALALYPDLAYEKLRGYIGTVIITFAIPLLITSVKEMRTLLIVMAASFGAIGLKYGFINLAHGGTRITWGFAGFHSDNNTLGFGLVLILPLCWYVRSFLPPLWRKAMTVTMFSTTAAAIMTYSRAAAVCLVVCYLILLARSNRKMLTALGAFAMLGPTVFLVWTSFTERISTIDDATEGSRRARLALAEMGLRMWRDYPIHGVGFGTTNQVELNVLYMGTPDPHVLHNNYLQIAVDSGTPALALFCALQFGALLWLGHSFRQMRSQYPEHAPIPAMLQCSLAVFAVGAVFASRTDYDLIAFLFGATAAWYNLHQTIVATRAPSMVTATAAVAPPRYALATRRTAHTG